MAISFDNTNVSGTGTGTAANVTVDITTASVGAFCISMVGSRTNISVSSFTGWTTMSLTQNISIRLGFDVWYRFKQSGDTTFTCTCSAANVYQVLWGSWLGVNTLTPFEAAGSNQSTTSNGTTPSESPLGPERLAVGLFDVTGGSSVSSIVFPAPSGMTIREQSFVNPSGNKPAGMIADANTYASAGSQSYTSVPTVTGGTATSTANALLFLIPAPEPEITSTVPYEVEQAVMRAATF